MGSASSVAGFQPRRRGPRRRLSAGAVAALFAVGAGGVAFAAGSGGFGNGRVGQSTKQGILLPSNQTVKPIGTRFLVRGARLLSSTLSPDGSRLAVLSWAAFTGFLTIMDLRSGSIVQQVGTGAPGDPVIGDGKLAADGPFYSPDGTSLWLPQASDLLHFAVDGTGKVSRPAKIPLTGAHGPALPSGMAFSADGSKAYVALNGSNALGVIDTATNTLAASIPVGNAPRQVVRVGLTAYVSDEGGAPARPGQYTNLSDGTPIVANYATGAATGGTVSVVNLATLQETNDIKVGLQPTAEFLSGDGTLMVANSNGDSVSLISTETNRVLQTINTNPLPGSTVGSDPNAITMPDAAHILVSIGRDNALAEYRYKGPRTPVQYEGLLPTDWYPVNVTFDRALHKVVVTNDKGIGARGPSSSVVEGPGTNAASGHNNYDDTGSVTVFSPPADKTLAGYTHQVFLDDDWQHLLAAGTRATPSGAAVAVPAQLGQPSAIKHVFLIVRENRTYDQVFGDIGRGNSDPKLTQFGASATPNAHALANRFGLFDNFYDVGTLSADGHNWLTQADANDYLEKEFGAFYRSYPAAGADALAYQRDGFLWNAATAARESVTDFGEYTIVRPPIPPPSWSTMYKESQILEGKVIGTLPFPITAFNDGSDVNSLDAINHSHYPAFDLSIPDQYRTDIFLQAFKSYEQKGNLPNLTIMWLPNDHTAGIGGGFPYPIAQVADNDLALGRIVDAISHSRFWSSSAIFVVEDDTQDGVDHVDGHRGPALVVSPYAKQHQLNDTYYTQLNVVRTIEQILGIRPMNQEDRAAEPMFDAFTNTANLAPFRFLPNEIPLTYGVPAAGSAGADSPSAMHVPAGEAGIYEQWVRWSAQQDFGGAGARQDQANPAQLNRLDWYTSKGWTQPYPGDTAILAPAQVPGARTPAAYIGDR